MENDKTIEEIFEDIKNENRLQILKEKLGQPKKDKNGILHSFPSSKFIKYLEYKNKYDELVNNIETLKNKVENGDTDAMNEINFSGTSQIKKIENALKLWIAIGYKNEIEKIIAESAK